MTWRHFPVIFPLAFWARNDPIRYNYDTIHWNYKYPCFFYIIWHSLGRIIVAANIMTINRIFTRSFIFEQYHKAEEIIKRLEDWFSNIIYSYLSICHFISNNSQFFLIFRYFTFRNFCQFFTYWSLLVLRFPVIFSLDSQFARF